MLNYYPPVIGSFGGGGGGGITPPDPPLSSAFIVDKPSSTLSASQETKVQAKVTIAIAKSIFFILVFLKV